MLVGFGVVVRVHRRVDFNMQVWKCVFGYEGTRYDLLKSNSQVTKFQLVFIFLEFSCENSHFSVQLHQKCCTLELLLSAARTRQRRIFQPFVEDTNHRFVYDVQFMKLI